MKYPENSYGFVQKIIAVFIACFIFTLIYSCNKENTNPDPGCLLKRCEIYTNWNSGEQLDTVNWEFDYNDEDLLLKYTTHKITDGVDNITEFIFNYDENEKVDRIDQFYDGHLLYAWLFKWDGNEVTMEQWQNDGDSIAFAHRKFVYEFNDRNELIKLSDYNTIENPEDEDAVFWEYWNFEYSDDNMIKMDDYFQESLGKTATYTYDNKKNPMSGQQLAWFFDFDLFLSQNNIVTKESFNHYLNQIYMTESINYIYNDHDYPIEMVSLQISSTYTKEETWKFQYDCDSL